MAKKNEKKEAVKTAANAGSTSKTESLILGEGKEKTIKKKRRFVSMGSYCSANMASYANKRLRRRNRGVNDKLDNCLFLGSLY